MLADFEFILILFKSVLFSGVLATAPDACRGVWAGADGLLTSMCSPNKSFSLYVRLANHFWSQHGT